MTQPPDIAPVLLRALADCSNAPTPLEAETIVSQILGMIWPGVEGDREEAVAYFCQMLADQLQARGAKARPALELLATQAPEAVAGLIADQAAHTIGNVPAWVPRLRTVRFLGAFSSIDVLAQHENFVLHFDYGPGAGGNHVIIALVDWQLGIVKDAFLVGPGASFTQLRGVFDGQPDLLIDETITADYLASQINPAMRATSDLPDLDMLGEETVEVWHLLASRMRACFTDPRVLTGPERTKLVNRFINRKATKELAERLGYDRGDLRLRVRAIVDYDNDVADGPWDDEDLNEFFEAWLPGRGLSDDFDRVVALLVEWRTWHAGL